ncbi:PAS domain S-box-containing protein [Sphingomonas sp. UYEF23]
MAIDAVQGILWTNDANGEMDGEQPGWTALTGQSPIEYRGFGWTKAVHPDDIEPTIAAWRDAVLHKRTFVFEHRLRRFDGQWRDYSIRSVPRLDATQSIVEWVSVHTDVTEQRVAEQALRESEARMRELNEQLEQRVANALAERRVFASVVETTDAFIQVLDTNCRFLAINRASADELERIYDIRPQVGDSIRELRRGDLDENARQPG